MAFADEGVRALGAWECFRMDGGIKGWWERLMCSHQWESRSSPSKYVGAFLPSWRDDTDYVTRQGFGCKKCGKWKVVEKKYGLYLH